ncbi:MAG: DUF1854 domain-containing protein [Chloroflexi bacterium]|nr:DUF1854 domain-containing protein [Chloroflexota bacterium]
MEDPTTTKAAPRSFEINHLDPATLSFKRQGDTLSLVTGDGTTYQRVVLRSCFPVSQDDRYLSVRDANIEEQPEIGIIDNWQELPEESKRAVAEELELYYFVPEIQRVVKLKKEFGFIYWTVETNKGPREFVMRDSVVHFAREVQPNRWLIIDVNQARYEIKNVMELDQHSRNLVKRFLYL